MNNVIEGKVDMGNQIYKSEKNCSILKVRKMFHIEL